MKQTTNHAKEKQKPSLEFKLLEYRMRINQELFDEKFIDYETFQQMEAKIIQKMRKYQDEMIGL